MQKSNSVSFFANGLHSFCIEETCMKVLLAVMGPTEIRFFFLHHSEALRGMQALKDVLENFIIAVCVIFSVLCEVCDMFG